MRLVDNRNRIYPIPKPDLGRCKSIKFRATFPKAESYGLHQVKEVVFALGLGPCGKHVLRLEHTVTDELLTIVQTSRHPDDLEEPLVAEHRALTNQLKKHSDATHHRHMMLIDCNKSYTTGHLWWKKTRYVKAENVWTPFDTDILEADQVAALQFRQSEIRKESQAWLDRLEVKTFTYKMSDVHGRIETIK